MWQLWALGSLVFGAGETIMDKEAIAKHRRIDSWVATFWRLCAYSAATCTVGYLGILGPLDLTFPPLIIGMGVLALFLSLGYTYLLRRVEITSIAAFFYLAPMLFLYIDAVLIGEDLSAYEIAGIILMVLGGFAFAIDGKTHHIKREFSPLVWFVIAASALYTGVEAYAFKHLHETAGVNGASFYASATLVATTLLLAGIVVRNKTHALFNATARGYIPQIIVSKSFDAGNSILWAQALTLASVSQVTAMGTLEPLMLIVCTAIAQVIFGWKTGEKFGKARVEWKAASAGMIVMGGLFIG